MDSAGKPYLEGLNPEQKAAVLCTEGPVLIVAGAGSGKTRVLTCRIANILDKGCPGERVMSLTFTRKAAGEMKERVSLMVGARQARRVVMGTFHSVFVRFLRQYAGVLGYPEQFTIYDQGDSTSAIKACIKELGLDDSAYKPREVLSRISMAKNNLYDADRYRNDPKIISADQRSKKPRICDIFSLYEGKCRQSGVMDYDDILLNMVRLMSRHKDALEEISSRFDYILVDEYQDTNRVQYLILKQLAARHRNICVVGDDSQSIYAFRGARIENILNFKKDYQECRTFRLERNYRSTKTIVDAANSVIAHNEGRIPKQCWSGGEDGDKIHVIKAYTEKEEAVLVCSSILGRIRSESATYKDFAILYRTNSQSRALEEALRTRNVPYMIYSGNSFYERAEVKDLMAWFKLVVNPNDDESFKRAVAKPSRGIGGSSMEALQLSARAKGTSLFAAAAAADNANFGLKAAGEQRIRGFCALVASLSELAHSVDAHETALRIADKSGLYAFYKEDTSIEGQTRFSNIEELLNSVAAFIEDRHEEILQDALADGQMEESVSYPTVTLDEFLENASLLSNVDVNEEEDDGNRVSLMTVHSAKGLEFPYVLITGLEENLFPSGGMLASPSDIEEERRLFYVALTRAGKAVDVTYAVTRMRNGQHASNPPSRFLREIDSKYLDKPMDLLEDDDDEEETLSFTGFGRRFGTDRRGWWTGGSKDHSSGGPAWRYGASSSVKYERRDNSRSIPPKPQITSTLLRKDSGMLPEAHFIPEPMTAFRTGQRIEHNRFGAGTIEDISGAVPDLKARINFERFGVKMIMLKYAKMRVLE